MRNHFKTFLLLLFIILSSGVIAQDQTVSGIVVDESGLTLPGATVIVQGTGQGTTTDFDGNYTITVPQGAILEYSFTGYATQEVVVSTSEVIDITMKSDAELIDQVVITGYGQTQNKRLVTTSISTLDQRVVADRPIIRVEQAIQGSAPAVVVIQESGSPGAPQTIRVRGISTAGDAGPLVMVNNVQVPDITFINSNDIKSINILKDAASAAIYGARGGNGVILLETKDGKRSTKPQFTLSSYFGVQMLATEGEYLNTEEYVNYYNESSLYQIREGEQPSGRPVFTDEELALLPNTTWIREVSDNASMSDTHLGISGGTESLSYYGSLGYLNQGGIIGRSSFQRKSLTLGANFDLGSKISANVFGSYSDSGRKFIAENNVNSRVISSVAALPPLYPARDSLGFPFNNGDQTGVSTNGVKLNAQPEFGNPLFSIDFGENKSSKDALYLNALVNYQMTDKLTLSTSAGYMNQAEKARFFFESFVNPNTNDVNAVNSLTENNITNKFQQWEAYLNYKFLNDDNHKLDLIVGTSLLQNEFQFTSDSGFDFEQNKLDDLPADIDSLERLSVAGERNTTQSFFGKANYNLRDKYIFGATVRADGSSKFGPNNKWGIFPSVSAGWIMSSEDFMSGISAIDLMKLRVSYGINGNDKIAPYQHIRRFADNPTGPSRLDVNEDIKWEEITQFNVGLDANLFENRIGITLDYYQKNTSDMLLAFPIPGFLGLPAPIRNAATVANTGIEAVLLLRQGIGNDWNFELGFNFGASTNEVTELNGGAPIPSANLRSFANSPSVTLTDEGHPIASFYGLKFDGVDESGNSTYVDQNEDGLIDERDRTIIGNPFPDFIYGINFRAEYKNFDLTTFLSGSQGNDVVNSAVLYSVVYGNRTRAQIQDMWTHENTDGTQPRPSANEVVNNDFSDYFIEDGSYLRFKNITLGYNLGENRLTNFGIENLRFYVSANNMITLTEYSGLDPEIGANNDPLNLGVDQGFYPQAKSVIGGFSVTF